MKIIKLSELTGNKRGRDYPVSDKPQRIVFPANDPNCPDYNNTNPNKEDSKREN